MVKACSVMWGYCCLRTCFEWNSWLCCCVCWHIDQLTTLVVRQHFKSLPRLFERCWKTAQRVLLIINIGVHYLFSLVPYYSTSISSIATALKGISKSFKNQTAMWYFAPNYTFINITIRFIHTVLFSHIKTFMSEPM